MAAVLERLAIGSKTVVLNTGSSLTNNSLAASSTFDNTTGATGDGYTRAIMTFLGTFASTPTANTGLSIWLIMSDDAAGGTFEDGSSSVTPARPADVVIPVRAVGTAQVVSRFIELVPGKFQVLVKNDGTGQTINTGWTLELTPITASYT